MARVAAHSVADWFNGWSSDVRGAVNDVVTRAQEGPGLEEIGRAKPFPPKDPVRTQPGTAEQVQFSGQGILVSGAELQVDAGMILQITAHPADVRDHADAVPAQLICRTDTRQHHQFRRIERAGT